jgi:ABC-type branched-subunit amino acid transport system ATPase component
MSPFSMGAGGLDVTGVSVVYGGHRAVDDVSLVAPQGRITGLIGPNGAGKKSLFNACSGLLRPAGGTIRLFGDDATHWSPAQRARRGLGRTFQRMEIVNAMTVRRNVAFGAECRLVGSNPFSQLVTRHDQRRTIDAAADEALEMCGIGQLHQPTLPGSSRAASRFCCSTSPPPGSTRKRRTASARSCRQP